MLCLTIAPLFIISPISVGAVPIIPCAVDEIDDADGLELPSANVGLAAHLCGGVLGIGTTSLAMPSGQLALFSRSGPASRPEAVLIGPRSANPASQFGTSAARVEDLMIIGDEQFIAPGNSVKGRVYVYDFATGELSSPIPQPPPWTSRYGLDIASDGDRMIVGAPDSRRGEDAPDSEGSAFIYRWDAGQWVQEAHLWNPSGDASDFHGWSVDIAGDVAVVGGHGIGNFGGAVVVYRFNGNAWNFEAKIDSPWGGQGYFGRSIHLTSQANKLAVGAPNAHGQNGAVYIFAYHNAEWKLNSTILASSPVGLAPGLGNSVYISDDASLVIAAAGDDEEFGFEHGAIHVFERQGVPYVEVAKVLPPEPTANGGFGSSIEVDGDVLAVGGWRKNGFGGAYLYHGITGADCNNNSLNDGCEIADGLAPDLNKNLIPDECELIADLDHDGLTGSTDLNTLLAAFGTTYPYWKDRHPADINWDLSINSTDLNLLLATFGAAAPDPR